MCLPILYALRLVNPLPSKVPSFVCHEENQNPLVKKVISNLKPLWKIQEKY